jgi:F-type H+-transporting ATPase subunit c
MRNLKVVFLVAMFLLLVSSPVFAQGGATSGVTGNIGAVGAVVGMAIAAGLCGLGQGKAVASSAEALARNPGAGAKIQTLMILGLAFIESLALVTFVVVLLKS